MRLLRVIVTVGIILLLIQIMGWPTALLSLIGCELLKTTNIGDQNNG